MPTFSLPIRPPTLTDQLQPNMERSSTAHHYCDKLVASVARLAPLHFRRKIARPVSCYAFFKGWLLLSQPPGCLSNLTSFST